jgi:serine/threonine protein kinase
MPAPTTVAEFIELVQKSGVVDGPRLSAYVQNTDERSAPPADPAKFANLLIRDGILTDFQAEQILQGKWRRFTIGNYKVLEKLGSGGMGQVFLAEHKIMRRKVAVKVLPSAKAEDPSSLERFHREARAVAALDHPHLVRAFDIGQDDNLHYLVMEYVDGASLQEIVKKTGPLDPTRACYYVHRTAEGLQYAYEVAGLIHRDVKPANIMVDRQGVVKLLDMGLARFFNDEDDILTKKYDENILGTADYLSPEQVTDSHGVDIRADIYSLGATFYFLLTGKPPFPEGNVSQKLIAHQTRQPVSVRLLRPGVPEGVAAVLERMMMKDPAARYQTPAELAGALAPFVPATIPAPVEEELPKLCPAASSPSGPTPPSVPSGRWAIPQAVTRPTASAAAVAAAPVKGTDRPSSSPPPQRSSPASRPRPAAATAPPAPPPLPRRDANPFANMLAGAERPAQNVYATAAARASASVLPPAVAHQSPVTKSRGVWTTLVVGLVLLVGGTCVAWWLTRDPSETKPAADPPPARRP